MEGLGVGPEVINTWLSHLLLSSRPEGFLHDDECCLLPSLKPAQRTDLAPLYERPGR